MPQFEVTVYFTCQTYVTVDAESPREAVDKVKDMSFDDMGIAFTDMGVDGIDNFERNGNYSVDRLDLR